MSYSSEVLADSPLGYWKFEYQGGTTTPNAPATLDDSSGNGRSLTNSGIVTGATPAGVIPGVAGDFGTASNRSAAITSPSWLNALTSYSVEAWINIPAGTAAAHTIAAQDNLTAVGGTGRKWNLLVSVGQIQFYNFTASAAPVAQSPLSSYADGNYHHVVGTTDGTTVKLYIDGSLVASTALGGAPTGSNVDLTVGRAASSNPGVGWIDELAIYPTALSAARISAHYAAGTSTAINLAPPKATVTAAAASPSVKISFSLAAPAALATAAAAAVVLSVGTAPINLTTPAANLAAASNAPTITRGPLSVPAATANVSARTPTLSLGAFSLNPPPSTASVTAPAPSINIAGSPLELSAPSATALASSPAPVLTLMVKIGRWTADQSQAALLDIEPLGGPLTVEPAIAAAPANIVEHLIRRQSHQAPALVPDGDGQVHSDGTYTVVDDVVGVPHLFVSNKDVTYFRGVPVIISEWSSTLPGGDETAAVDFPQLTFADVPGTGDLAWLKPDAQAEIYLIDANGHRIQPAMFCGHMVSDNVGHTQNGLTNGWHLEGSLSQANYQGHRVPTYLNTTDIGPLIAKHLNGVISRRYAAIKPVNTGITTMNRGSYSDTEWDYVQALLGVAWTDDGHQWTVGRTSTPRTFKIALKDTSTVNWTLTAGAPGIEVDLTADQSSVVHAIFGRGVGPDGYSWAGWVYPNLGIDNAPAYPYASAGTTMSIGSTDAGTLTGRGVSDWQERARQLGYRITVDGSYSSDDAATCRQIQERYGLTVDGIVGPQTWDATFAVGSNAGSLDGAYRRPLAVLPSVEPRLTTADGGDAGPNPAYNPAIIRRELDLDYGTGVRKADATVSAQRQLARDSQPGWAGTITMQTDFHEGSRFLAFEGQNIKLLGHRGADPLLHIVTTNKKLDQGLTCTFDVDSKARDAMTLASIMVRDVDSKPDPTRRPGILNRKSRLEQDMVVDFDGESGAGVIPRHALFGGLWTVIRIPVSQVGRIAKLDISTSGPASKFAIALFGSPIQPSHLQRLVGNPLASTGPWTTHADTLADAYGFIEGWGEQGQAAGYYPGSEGSGSLTGRMLETSTIEYVSQTPPWVWVAEYSDTSCFISGRIYPAPVT